MKKCEPNEFIAIVTDPPYSLEEFKRENLEKMKRGSGGVWRIPPKIGGVERNPLPRFTVFSAEHHKIMFNFFHNWAKLAYRVLVPGGHLVIASTPIFLPTVAHAIIEGGFEPRGVIVRLVQTLRGGFRPKNAEEEFKELSTIPRAHWEPWAIFRKPIEKGSTVAENLKKWKSGALKREPDGRPFPDVIPSERTPKEEEAIAPHPTLKPQSFMRRIIRAVVPLNEGKVLDPFCGAGSTIAAIEALGFDGIGIEVNPEYYEMALKAIPQLARVNVDPWLFERRINKGSKMLVLTEFLLKEGC
ncbi:DNA-methyltransferase [Candidatus Hecatella orcuttiae]|uniref:DNA-methyltransferase n=1 Tax=Candidatus Hecatella orcuttiae TaxID=1935119 RepID=UPI002867EA4A|nr:DNA methyltransferase [Candidatus Hecatella orcuttiae]